MHKTRFINKISTQFIGALLILFVFFIIICFNFLQNLDLINYGSKNITDSYLPAIVQEDKFEVQYQRIQRTLYAYLLFDGAQAKEQAELREELNTGCEEFLSLAKDLSSYYEEDDTGYFDGLVDAANTYVEGLQKAASLKENCKLDEAFHYAYHDLTDTETTLSQYQKDLSDSLHSFIDEIKSDQEQLISKTSSEIALGIGTYAVFLALILFFLHFTILNKLKKSSIELNQFITELNSGKGDLTKRIHISCKNEIQGLISGINQMIASLDSIISKVRDSSGILSNSSITISTQVEQASSNISDTSSALEDISSNIDSVSTSTLDLQEQLTSAQEFLKDIQNRAEDGSQTAYQVKETASKIQISVQEKKELATQKVSQINVALKQSLADSAKVSQINQLTEEILSIASQTNLLALNASIEAARAGEVGKGFAVVANEISSLAESSRNTANNIQNISFEVTSAVESLIDNATNVLQFIDNTIMADYDNYVATGNQYEQTAGTFDSILNSFVTDTKEFRIVIDEIIDSMSAIATSLKESSSSIELSAHNSTLIIDEMQAVEDSVAQNTVATQALETEVQKFQNSTSYESE